MSSPDRGTEPHRDAVLPALILSEVWIIDGWEWTENVHAVLDGVSQLANRHSSSHTGPFAMAARNLKSLSKIELEGLLDSVDVVLSDCDGESIGHVINRTVFERFHELPVYFRRTLALVSSRLVGSNWWIDKRKFLARWLTIYLW